MANNHLSDLSLNPISISDLTGVNISEGMQRNLINNAVRQLGSMIKADLAGDAGTITSASTLSLASISTGDYIKLTASGGSSSITSFGSIANAGLHKWLEIIGTITLRNSSALAVQSGGDYTLSTGDLVYVRATEANTWRTAIFRNNGYPVVDQTLGKHLIYFPAKGMERDSLSGAEFVTVRTATNHHNYVTLNFDRSVTEYASFEFKMPKSYNSSTITFKINSEATSSSGNATWALQAVGISSTDPVDATWGTAVTVAASYSTANVLHVSAESSALTIGGSITADDLVQFLVYRSPADAGDTLLADARLRGIDIFITTDKPNDS